MIISYEHVKTFPTVHFKYMYNLWYVNYISIKLLKNKLLKMSSVKIVILNDTGFGHFSYDLHQSYKYIYIYKSELILQ